MTDGHEGERLEFDPDAAADALDVSHRPAELALIFAGGAGGALARYGVARISPVGSSQFPWPTFAVNVLGAFVLGLFLTIVLARFVDAWWARPLFAVGFLGAFTTFSTLAVETVVLVKDDHVALGVAYFAGSIVVGLLAAIAGVRAGRVIADRVASPC